MLAWRTSDSQKKLILHIPFVVVWLIYHHKCFLEEGILEPWIGIY